MSSERCNGQQAYFLGVDGGGSKTAFCVLDRHGEIRAHHRGPSCNYLSVGMDAVESVLTEGIGAVCRDAGIAADDLQFAAFGIPGYGEITDDTDTLDAMPAGILGHDRYCCMNDMVCGWAGSLGAVDGINIVAGTGSLTYGEYQGRHTRCGGWGWRFGDEGSAYWIGNWGLNLFTRMHDGRQSRDVLYDLFYEQLELHDAGDVIARFLRCASGRQKIAELAMIVLQAAEAGDAGAWAIAKQAAQELALLVDVTRQRLAFDETEPVLVSYSGGVFNSETMVRLLDRNLETLDARYELREPLYAPEIGAAVYAAKQANASVAPSRTLPESQ